MTFFDTDLRHAAFALTLLVGACGAAPAPTAQNATAQNATGAAMLPNRELTCTLGRISNFDPTREQRPDEYTFEGQHRLVLFLPAIPVRTGPAPDPVDPADPVDPKTRIVSDPDGLAADLAKGFDRVVDYWPERVELTGLTTSNLSKLLIVSDGDETRGTANLFLTTAGDALTFDEKRLFAGRCEVRSS